jgi:hypothetical protein
MARNPRSGDGSAPAIGELVSEAGGSPSRRRVPPPGERAGLFQSGDSDGDSSRSGFDAHKAAARAAQAAINSGATAADGAGPVKDPTGYLSGGSSSRSGGTWADPSSLSG